MGAIYMSQFTAEAARGLVLPTLFLYCQSLGGSLEDMGRATSIFSIGRLASSVLLGWLCDRFSFRSVHILCAIIGIFGNLLYVAPASFKSSPASTDTTPNAFVWLYASRFLVGFGAGNLSVCRANVAAMTPMRHRLQYMNRLAVVVFLGYALSPGIGGLFASLNIRIWEVPINAFTMPGLLLAALNLLSLVCMLVMFDNSIEASDSPSLSSQDDATPHAKLTDEDSLKRDSWGIAIFLLLNVVGRGVIASFETVLVPLHLQTLQAVSATSPQDPVHAVAAFQFFMGLLGLLTYVAVELWRDALADIAWLVLGLGGVAVGNALLLVEPPKWSVYCTAIYLVWSVGGPLLTAVTVAAFSKLLGAQPQGLWMGVFGSVGSAARIVVPVIPALFATLQPMFWINLGLSGFGIVMLTAFIVHSARRKAAREDAEPPSVCV
ncbi:hypothetical protein B5M09_011487 [Aphanomyces astaci]|uniref:Major facilitator superfamily (MFS) profile domain-containing protein n=1 Tax=Aphanomyces astaci TaxID=112090 RepID=A0A3R7YID7_APHAT|nr:hypothetical protein B5M09_011487 [Aphanomyces astaci]